MEVSVRKWSLRCLIRLCKAIQGRFIHFLIVVLDYIFPENQETRGAVAGKDIKEEHLEVSLMLNLDHKHFLY